MSDALDRWLRDVHLFNDTDARARLNRDKESMENVLTGLKSFIQAQAGRDALKDASATQSDPVLTELDRLLHGRIGEPFPETKLAAARKEAKERAEKHIPPGYEDFKDKPIEKAAGDYLLWAQILDEAERRESDVLLVTGDVKPDWWIPATSHAPARPRTELTLELRKRAGTRLFMVTPSQLLAQANEIFNLRVDERSVNDLATAEREQSYPSSYSHAIQSMLRQQFPEAQVLTLDDQIGKGMRTPIPDLSVIHSGGTIGIEVKKYTQPVRAEDIGYLKRMVEEHRLSAALVVSHSPLTAPAMEHLRNVASETGAKVAWVRINSTHLEGLGSYEALAMSVESLISTQGPEGE